MQYSVVQLTIAVNDDNISDQRSRSYMPNGDKKPSDPRQGDDEDTRIALTRKQNQAKSTWNELCSIPDRDVGGGSAAPQAVAGEKGVFAPGTNSDGVDEEDGGNDVRDEEDTELPPGSRCTSDSLNDRIVMRTRQAGSVLQRTSCLGRCVLSILYVISPAG